jgi:hypothetical protein
MQAVALGVVVDGLFEAPVSENTDGDAADDR